MTSTNLFHELTIYNYEKTNVQKLQAAKYKTTEYKLAKKWGPVL